MVIQRSHTSFCDSFLKVRTFFSIQPTHLTVFLAFSPVRSSLITYGNLAMLLPGGISSRLKRRLPFSEMIHSFKQPSNDISDREMRPHSLSGFREMKSLIDGGEDEKASCLDTADGSDSRGREGKLSERRQIRAISCRYFVCKCLSVSVGDELFVNVMRRHNINHLMCCSGARRKKCHLMRDG